MIEGRERSKKREAGRILAHDPWWEDIKTIYYEQYVSNNSRAQVIW